MNPPYGIYKYDINTLSVYISSQTSTPFHHIKQKRQISYLDNYLSHFDKNLIYFVYENEYIDKYYLDDYAEYYVKCFKDYKDKCSRVHFFKENSGNSFIGDFKKILTEGMDLIDKYEYLGFIVIRPIPQTFLAQICLKPYSIDNKKVFSFLTRTYNVSLFGITLDISSVSFQEQDKILAACATSALWSFFQAHPNINSSQSPSASAITKNSYPEYNGHDREFPNSGLSTEMICRCLRKNNLDPQYFEFFKGNHNNDLLQLNSLKEYIYAYSSSRLPLILGVSVKEVGTKENLGLHAITILGYSIDENLKHDKKNKFKLTSNKLSKIYVHDDRIGPYTKMEFSKNKLRVKIDKNKNVTGMEIFNDEIYTPETLVIGVYHKIRISYKSIKETCQELMVGLIRHIEKKFGMKGYYRELVQNFEWTIKIKINSEIKKSILKSDVYNKEKLLISSWPKYIWSAKASLDGIDIFEFLFDATDIKQGDVFFEILHWHNEVGDIFFRSLELYCESTFNYQMRKNPFSKDPDDYIWGIIKYFRKQKKENHFDNLNDLFGIIKFPNKIKHEEIEKDIIIDQCIVRLSKICDPKDFELNKNLENEKKYIWAIDSHGYLCIGIEDNRYPQGHPTLTDGEPARIAGEITYNDNKWYLNPKSGRFSKDYSDEEKKIYLLNAKTYRFNVYFPNDEFAIDLNFEN